MPAILLYGQEIKLRRDNLIAQVNIAKYIQYYTVRIQNEIPRRKNRQNKINFISCHGNLPVKHWENPKKNYNRPVHALMGIMGNQGKFTKKQGRKTNVFLYIPVLISHLVTKHIQQAEKPLF